jgi:hypothetical protein
MRGHFDIGWPPALLRAGCSASKRHTKIIETGSNCREKRKVAVGVLSQIRITSPPTSVVDRQTAGRAGSGLLAAPLSSKVTAFDSLVVSVNVVE